MDRSISAVPALLDTEWNWFARESSRPIANWRPQFPGRFLTMVWDSPRQESS